MKKEKPIQNTSTHQKKARYNAKTCYEIFDENQEKVTQPDKILEIQRDFYEELYKKDDDVNFQLKNETQIRVPEEIKKQQDQQITMKNYKKQ